MFEYDTEECHFLGGVDGNLFFGEHLGGRPYFLFERKAVSGKAREIASPNKFMRKLHSLFSNYLKSKIETVSKNDFYPLRNFPSATAFVKGSNTLQNADKHKYGKFFYITDIVQAFNSVDLKRLAALIVYICKEDKYCSEFGIRQISARYEEIFVDDDYPKVLRFLTAYFSSEYGVGLAIGGPASPMLLNLYMECYVDIHLRRLCENKGIVYTRYADDLVFSSELIVSLKTRKLIRGILAKAGLTVNNKKSFVRALCMGTVFVTKFGLSLQSGGRPAILVFPQEKRKKLHAIIYGYMTKQTDHPEKVSGYIAEFLHYYENVGTKTESDKKTFALCRQFKEEWSKYEKTKVMFRGKRRKCY